MTVFKIAVTVCIAVVLCVVWLSDRRYWDTSEWVLNVTFTAASVLVALCTVFLL